MNTHDICFRVEMRTTNVYVTHNAPIYMFVHSITKCQVGKEHNSDKLIR